MNRRNLLVFILLAFISNIARADILKVGYSVAITNVTPERMKEAKVAGIDCIEVSLSQFINKQQLTFLKADEEIAAACRAANKAATEAGVEIWSVHMPFSKEIDLSLADEDKRIAVVALHQKVLSFCQLLSPKIILFHPSYFLGLNERELRKQQLIKSAIELNRSVKKMGATMVIENMTGFELVMADGKRERPLLRTVEESLELFSRLPKDIYSAIDLNHIVAPEKLILAIGKRLKTIHVADGDGKSERHFFPCDGKGENNWPEIMKALDKVGYKGPFMYESKSPPALKDYKECYMKLAEQIR